MLYEILYAARTEARKKGLITSGKNVFVKFSKEYFIIRDEKKCTYYHSIPLLFQIWFPQRNVKKSGSYQLGYLITILYILKLREKGYNFQYTLETLELKGSGFFIKLNSIEYRIKLKKEFYE